MTIQQLSSLILAFIGDEGEISEWEWDDFITVRSKQPDVEAVRLRLLDIETKHPPTSKGMWCSDIGVVIMRDLALQLRENDYHE